MHFWIHSFKRSLLLSIWVTEEKAVRVSVTALVCPLHPDEPHEVPFDPSPPCW